VRLIDGFRQTEALEALYYCRRNLRVQQMYLEWDRRGDRNTEYSEFKVKDALDDLHRAQERIKAFGLDCFNPDFYQQEKA
jgi:hypothetical protein